MIKKLKQSFTNLSDFIFLLTHSRGFTFRQKLKINAIMAKIDAGKEDLSEAEQDLIDRFEQETLGM